jgi:hypothetical protein
MGVGLAWKADAASSPAMKAFRDYFKHLYLDPVMASFRSRS